VLTSRETVYLRNIAKHISIPTRFERIKVFNSSKAKQKHNRNEAFIQRVRIRHFTQPPTMPSSSSRSTFHELSLIHYFRIVSARLNSARLPKQASWITDHFVEILDISKPELMKTIKPLYDPSHTTWAGWKADIKQFNDLQASNAKVTRSAKIMYAGNALADVGAELFRAGRNGEAASFCELGEQVWGWSVEAYEEEQRHKAGVQYYADGDQEMEMEY
jgi:hypothetical protein